VPPGEKGTPPTLELITEEAERAELLGATLDDLARAGAQRMIAAALEVEVAEYLGRYRGSAMARGTPWWCATAEPGPAR
jgi:hypothetical protein